MTRQFLDDNFCLLCNSCRSILYSSEAEAYAEADDEGDGGRDEGAGGSGEAEAEAVRGLQPDQDGESQELDGATGGQASIYGSSYSVVS